MFTVSQIGTAGLFSAVVCWIGLTGPGEARQINWRSPLGGANVLSDGTTPMDSGFRFELGAFANGFTPSADNVEEWEENWRSVDNVEYNESTRFFAGSVVLESNEAPFGTGAKAYIWAFDGRQGSREWILLESTKWKWPAAAGGLQFPIDWEVDDSTVAVVGETNGVRFLMKTAAVQVGDATYADEWRAGHFSADEIQDSAIGGWNADPDKDGSNNILEFVAGTHPRRYDAPEISIGRDRRIRLAVDVEALSFVTLSLEASDDLAEWENVDSILETENGAATFAGNGKAYFRIEAALR